ncbi:hypothetical protein Tco_0960446, partial [Tanacetum coccineum]
MSNVAPQQYNSKSSINPSSTYVPPHFTDNSPPDSGLSPTDNLIMNLTNTLALLTQSYKTYHPQTNNRLRTSSNPRNQDTVQDGRVVVQNVQGRQNRGQGNNARGAGTAGYGGAQNRVRNANPGQARQNGVALDEEQLLFLAGGHDNAIDEDVDEQPVQDLALNVDNVFKLMTVMLLILMLMRLPRHKLCSWLIVSLNFIESIKEARSCVQDLTSGEIV